MAADRQALRQEATRSFLIVGVAGKAGDRVVRKLLIKAFGQEFQSDRRVGIVLPRPVISPQARRRAIIQEPLRLIRSNQTGSALERQPSTGEVLEHVLS